MRATLTFILLLTGSMAAVAAEPAIKNVAVEFDAASPNWTWVRVEVDDLDPTDTQTTLTVQLDGMVETEDGILNDGYSYSLGADKTFYFGIYGTKRDYPSGVATVTLKAWSGEKFSAEHVFDTPLSFDVVGVNAAKSKRAERKLSAYVSLLLEAASPKPSDTKPSLPPDPKREAREPQDGKPKKEEPLFPRDDKGEVKDKTKTPDQIKGNEDNNRSDTGENDATLELIKGGYKIFRNPPPTPDKKRPDLTMEGEYADVYTPGPGKDARGVGGEVVEKVDKRKQVKRVIINLRDNDKVTPDEIRKDIAARRANNELKDLEEVKVITKGPPRKIVTVFP